MLVMLSVILDMFLPTLSTENSKSVLDYSCMNNVMPDISYSLLSDYIYVIYCRLYDPSGNAWN